MAHFFHLKELVGESRQVLKSTSRPWKQCFELILFSLSGGAECGIDTPLATEHGQETSYKIQQRGLGEEM